MPSKIVLRTSSLLSSMPVPFDDDQQGDNSNNQKREPASNLEPDLIPNTGGIYLQEKGEGLHRHLVIQRLPVPIEPIPIPAWLVRVPVFYPGTFAGGFGHRSG